MQVIQKLPHWRLKLYKYMKFHKGDTILVTAGKDKGRQGQVERIFRDADLLLIPGVNQYKKHRKPTGEDRPGEIVTLSRPLPTGNIALVCPKCKLPTRIGYRLDGDKKIRICRKCKNDIDTAAQGKTQNSKTKVKENNKK
jgi:large subunit ribosomal protein L24